MGALKHGEKDWSLALFPGGIQPIRTFDMSKVLQLESVYSESKEYFPHSTFDLMPGHGVMKGKTVLVWRFGSHYLAGALS